MLDKMAIETYSSYGDMMRNRTEEIRSFAAIAEDGRSFMISEFQEFISAVSHANANAEVAGLKFYRTSDGKAVSTLGDGRFTIVGERVEVSRQA